MPRLFGHPRTTIPGPRVLPLVGPLASLVRFLEDPVGVALDRRRYGDVAAVTQGNPAVVFVYGAEHNRQVLSQPSLFQNDEGLFRGPDGSALADLKWAIISINGDTHKRHRRLMQPAFTRSALDSYAQDIVGVTQRMLARWPTDGEADVSALCRSLSLVIAVKCFYGLDLEEGAEELGQLGATFVDHVTAPATILAPVDLPGTPYRRTLRLAETLTGRLRELVAAKRARTDRPRDVLGLLMGAGHDEEGFSEAELVAEAMTLFVAGHDTNAITLSWTLFLLSQHPGVLAGVLEEVDRELGGAPPTPAALPRLTRLDRAIRESMRIIPPAPLLFFRTCAAATEIGGHVVPADATVMVSPVATHHDPALFPRPESFDPDRWTSISPTLYEYLPFGAGPRICVGKLFGEQALRLILAMIVQRFRLSVIPGARIARLTRANLLHLRHGLPMRIEGPHREHRDPAVVVGDVHDLVELPTG